MKPGIYCNQLLIFFCFPIMLRAGIIRGEHDSCAQTVPFAMAASKYQTEVEFHYLSANDIQKRMQK